MEILEKLTPAETYLIKSNSNSTFRELLKLTLADLCLKKVLRIEDREFQSHPNNPIRVLKYVVAGKNFQSYQPKIHELAYLSPFQKNDEIEILFNHMIKIAYENAGNRNRYVFRALLKNYELTKKFQKDIFAQIFGNINLNNEGKEAKAKVDQILNTLETELPQIIQDNKKKALEILKRIGGNVFLISGLEFELLKKIDEEMARELERSRDNNTYGCGGCYTFYGDYSGSFDGAFDSTDSSGDSGCGGDSGCSGCGGCGGCS